MKVNGEKVKKIFKPTKKKVIFTVLALCVIIGGGYFIGSQRAAAAAAAEEPAFNTAEVSKQDLKKEVSVNGVIASVNKKTVQEDLADVEVKEVNVKIGDVVKAGDVICTLDSSTIDTKLQNAQAAADVAAAKSAQALADAKKSLDNSVTDQNTNSGRNDQAITDSYNGLQEAIGMRDDANAKVQAAQAALAQAIDQLNQAQDQATKDALTKDIYGDQNTKGLQGALSDAQAYASDRQAYVDTKEAAYRDAQQKKQDTSVTDSRDVLAKDSALDSAKLDAQANSSSDTALTIAELQKQKDSCTVTAPIDGTITSLQVEVGDIYKGTEIATIQDASNLQVTAYVDQYTVSDITQGMSTIIKSDTTGDEEMAGTLSFVSPVPKSEIDNNGKITVTTDYEIHADFAEQNDRLRLGMNAKTTILIAEAKNVLSVPSSCVQTDGDRTFVTVLEDEDSGKTKDIDVTVGLKTDYDVEVSGSGLKEGMKVVIPDDVASDTESSDIIYQ